MRIFYASETSPNANFRFQSHVWRRNLYLPLVDLGHAVVEFEFDLGETFRNLDPEDPRQAEFIARNRPRVTQALLTQIRAAHRQKPVDVFFSYFTDACITPEAVVEIRTMGITTLNWYCNGSYLLRLVAEISPHYDWCLVPEKFRLEDYRKLGARPIYCQEAANPNFYHPHDLPVEFGVTFVGQRYGNRPLYLRRLVDAGIDLRVWGAGWEPRPLWRQLAARVKRLWAHSNPLLACDLPARCCGGPLSDDELIKMYSRSKISLGFTTVAELPRDGAPAIKQVRLRDFEATMSGAFYLVEQFDELTEFFEPDREIVFFRDGDELVDKARYYLTHDAERERIRQAGLKRARAEHTWHRRFQTVFDRIGLK